MTPNTLILKNATRRPTRSALMIVSIAVAFGIFGVLFAFRAGVEGLGAGSAAGRLVVVNKLNYTQPLPVGYVERVRALASVAQATHFTWIGGYVRELRNAVPAMAVDAESWLKVYDADYAIAPEARAAFLADRGAALVGASLARAQGWKTGDDIPVSSDIYFRRDGGHTWPLRIAGIVEGRDGAVATDFLVFHYAYLDELRGFGRDTVGWIAVQAAEPARADALVRAVDAEFANSAYETDTESERAFIKAFGAQFGDVGKIVVLVVGAAFLTILMIVGNTFVMAVRERAAELAVMRTLGFSGAMVVRLIVAEALLLCLCGGGLGLAGAALALAALRAFGSGIFAGLALQPGIVASAFAVMGALALTVGLPPALSALRAPIAVAQGKR